MRRSLLLVLLTSTLLAASAWAQITPKIPDKAHFGRYVAQSFPRLLIDRQEYQLAPGARIFNERRQTVTPNMLPTEAYVRFLLDARGQVQTLWVVSEEQFKTAKDVQARRPSSATEAAPVERSGPTTQ
jgi:hypothetical protein